MEKNIFFSRYLSYDKIGLAKEFVCLNSMCSIYAVLMHLLQCAVGLGDISKISNWQQSAYQSAIVDIFISRALFHLAMFVFQCVHSCQHQRGNDGHPVSWRLAGSLPRPRELFTKKSGLACLSWCIGGQFLSDVALTNHLFKLAAAHWANSTMFLEQAV